MTTQISRSSVVDELASRLREDVLSGRYPPGSYLPAERELADSYRVTRTSLKHAIVRLVQAGLLETRHGVGTRVRDYMRFGGPELLPMLVATAGAEWMREIFMVRREVGSLVAAKAAENANGADRDRLRSLLEDLRTAADAGAAQLVECEIHRAIAAATHNRVYGFLVNAMLSAYLEVRTPFQHAFADPGGAADRMLPAIDAIAAGDRTDAHAAATGYLAETEQIMLTSFPSPKGTP